MVAEEPSLEKENLIAVKEVITVHKL